MRTSDCEHIRSWHVLNRRPSAPGVEVITLGLWVSPDNRRSFNTAVKIADRFRRARSVMSQRTTRSRRPCPCCSVSGTTTADKHMGMAEHQTLRVLVVDDEVAILTFASRVLSEAWAT